MIASAADPWTRWALVVLAIIAVLAILWASRNVTTRAEREANR